MEFRAGRLSVDDPVFGLIELEGDGFSAAGELATISTLRPIQERLGVTHEQADEIARLVREYRAQLVQLHARAGPRDVEGDAEALRREYEQRIADVLGDAAPALKALSLRVRNGDALLDEDVARALGLSAEQRATLARVRDENRRTASARSRQFSGARFTTAQAFESRAREAQGGADERLLAVLTPSQLEEFERAKRGG